MKSSVLESIRAFLAANQVSFREMRHAPTYTSEQAAAARGEPLEIGGKAIVAKVGKDFRLFVLSGARRLNSRAICKHLGETRFRFATAEELLELTGLRPGCIPPFGRPLLPFPLYVDRSVTANESIAFNAGSHTVSMILDRDDYLAAARPEDIFDFSR
jgi:prolyl-tRNA editing enzyme YbaK/EbsC (Cys-tRNA(Pro) deacylase)